MHKKVGCASLRQNKINEWILNSSHGFLPYEMEMGTYNLCRTVPARLCLGKSKMSHDKAITMCCEALETDAAGERVAPHLHPVRRHWLLQRPAANASSVAPLVAVKTELCCNEYKEGYLLKLLNAYRPCNSHWLSGFQTGSLMLPHKVSLSLALASVATKALAKERLKCSVLPVLFTGFFIITLHTLCWMHFAARHIFVLGILQLFSQASNWPGCQCWFLFSEVLWASAMLLGLGFHPDKKLEIYCLELVFKCQTDTSFLLLTKSWGQTNIPDAAVGVNGFINSRSRVPWTLLLAASKEGKLTFKYFVFKVVVVFLWCLH